MELIAKEMAVKLLKNVQQGLSVESAIKFMENESPVEITHECAGCRWEDIEYGKYPCNECRNSHPLRYKVKESS